MNKLDLQYKDFAIVVGARDLDSIQFESAIFELTLLYSLKYIYIQHDKDSEYLHYHVLLMFDKRIRCSTVLNKLAHLLTCDINNISISGCKNINAYTQYMLHYNEPNKHQYAPFELFSNLDSDYITTLLHTTDYIVEINTELLLDAIHKCCTKLDLFKEIGLSNYNKYRNVINDLWKIMKLGEVD